MLSLHLPRQFISIPGTTYFFSFILVLGFSTLLLSGSVQLFSLHFALILVLIAAVFTFFTYLKSCHQNSCDSAPRFHSFRVIHTLYYFLKNRNRARTLSLAMVYGGCVCYPKEGMYSITLGTRQYTVLYNPDTVEAVLSSNRVLQKGFPYGMAKDLLKQGLITSSGNKWHSRRKLLTPTFHFKILQEFIPAFNIHAKSFVKNIEEFMEKHGSFDIMPLSRLCAMDVVLETLMGKRRNSEVQVNEYVEALNSWSECFSKRVLFPLLWPDFIFFRTELGKTSLKNLDVMERFTKQVITDRLRERSKRQKDTELNDCNSSSDDIGRKTKKQLAFLDLLLDLHMQNNEYLSLQDITEEAATFVFAGHDTTSSAVSWTLYLLGLHQDTERSVQEELDMVLGDDADRMITSEDISKLKYLTCVLKESLRLYPPVPMVTRNVSEHITINGCKIRKGTTVVVNIYMLHRNPEMFPNPEEFNPDRFNLENSKKRHPFAYVPFSAGPRNCIGQKFATNEVMIVLATVLRHFNVSSVEHRDRLKLIGDVIVNTENGLHLKFTKRYLAGNYTT